MPLVHLNQLAPPPAKVAPAPGTVPAPQPSVASPSSGDCLPPIGQSPAPSASWGAFSQRLFDKLDAVERSASNPVAARATGPDTRLERT